MVGAEMGGLQHLWSCNDGESMGKLAGLEHLLFFHILGITIPTDELIFFRGVGQPPTSYFLMKWNGGPTQSPW